MKNKSLLFILVILILVGIGSSLAYFNSTAILENIFEAGTYKTITHEEFISPTNWKPGDTTPKTITTKNEGTIPVRIRVKLEESWTSKNNDNLNLTFNNEDVSIINYSSMDKWIYEDGYFYYDGELAPGDTTPSLLESITFNPNIPSSVLCTKNAEGTREDCESTGDGYDDATYKLNITTETVQANKYLTVWGLDHPIEKYAMFDKGTVINIKLKQLAGNTSVDVSNTTVDNSITAFLKANTAPDNSILNDEHLVSHELSNYPIYAWFDNGNIYWWCEEDNVYFNESAKGFFAYLKSLTNISGVQDIGVSKTKNLSNIFSATDSLIDYSPVANWDTSKVTNMGYMFYYNKGITSLESFEDFDVSNVTDMSAIFYECDGLTSLSGVEDWDVSKVENMMGFVMRCDYLTDISQVADWKTSSLTSLDRAFTGTHSLSNYTGLEDWDTSNVLNLNLTFGMGSNDNKYGYPAIDFSPISGWDVSKVENMTGTFQNIDILSFEAFTTWDVGKVKLFSNCFNATTHSIVTTLHGLEDWNVSSATRMDMMFYDNRLLSDASAINNWDVRNVIYFNRMFETANVHPEFTMVTGTWNNGTFTRTN